MVWKWVVPFVMLLGGCPYEQGGFVFHGPGGDAGRPTMEHHRAP